MPRKPTWDDVPRWTDGRFAKRTRFELVAEKAQPGFVRTSLAILWVLPLNMFSVAAVAKVLGVNNTMAGLLILTAAFLSFPIGYAFFRTRFWWLLGYTVVTMGLIVWAGVSSS